MFACNVDVDWIQDEGEGEWQDEEDEGDDDGMNDDDGSLVPLSQVLDSADFSGTSIPHFSLKAFCSFLESNC